MKQENSVKVGEQTLAPSNWHTSGNTSRSTTFPWRVLLDASLPGVIGVSILIIVFLLLP